MNSQVYDLQNTLTGQDDVDTILLEMCYEGLQNKAIVIIEGDSDLKLYRKLLSKAHVTRVNGAKARLIEVANLFKERGETRVIAIRDADYDCILERSETNPLLFWTDGYDAEMMMVYDDETFNSLVCEFLNTDQPISELREKIATGLYFLSVVRLINDRDHLGLTFSGLPVTSNVDPITHEIDRQAISTSIKARSGNRWIDEAVLAQALETHTDQTQKELCRGHDFVHAFQRLSTVKGINSDHIESGLRTAYNHVAFQRTDLYQSLKTWEASSTYTLFAN